MVTSLLLIAVRFGLTYKPEVVITIRALQGLVEVREYPKQHQISAGRSCLILYHNFVRD